MALIPLFWQGRIKYLTLLMVVLAAIMCRLGVWQYSRHLERSALNAQIRAALDAPPLTLDAMLALPEAERAFRRVRIDGHYTEQQLLWRNRERAGATGFHLLTTFVTTDGRTLLVNRGWIPYQAGTGDAWLTLFPPPTGTQQVTGVWYRETNAHDLSRETNPQKWFDLDTAAMSAVMGVTLLPGVVQIQPDGSEQTDVWPIPAETQDLGIGSHLGYTVQWFSFALILLVGYTVIRVRALRSQAVV